MIKIVYEEKRGNEEEFEYCQDYEGIALGDMITVKTRYGTAIATVIKLDAKCEDPHRCKEVLSIIRTEGDREEADSLEEKRLYVYERETRVKERESILTKLEPLVTEGEFKQTESMNLKELTQWYLGLAVGGRESL